MIQTEPEMRDLMTRANKAPRVALDTEFIWERTFYPRLGVVQLGFSEREGYLIDAVALPSLPGMDELLSNPKTEKLLHDAQQDLSILARTTGAQPCAIFDTRRAAGFAGMPSTSSLRGLLRDVLNVEIPKTETRSNWLRRPLSKKQIAYALNDVRFLPELREALLAKARELGNDAYLHEEMRLLDTPDFYAETTAIQVFQRMKTGRLRKPGRDVLLELVRWRETVARTRDLPRAHVLRDADLFALARHAPAHPQDISRIDGLPRAAATRYCRGILEAVATGLEASENAPPPPAPIRGRASQIMKEKTARRVQVMRDAATEAGIDPALVASKASIIDLLVAEDAGTAEHHPLMNGWRRRFAAPGSST